VGFEKGGPNRRGSPTPPTRPVPANLCAAPLTCRNSSRPSASSRCAASPRACTAATRSPAHSSKACTMWVPGVPVTPASRSMYRGGSLQAATLGWAWEPARRSNCTQHGEGIRVRVGWRSRAGHNARLSGRGPEGRGAWGSRAWLNTKRTAADSLRWWARWLCSPRARGVTFNAAGRPSLVKPSNTCPWPPLPMHLCPQNRQGGQQENLSTPPSLAIQFFWSSSSLNRPLGPTPARPLDHPSPRVDSSMAIPAPTSGLQLKGGRTRAGDAPTLNSGAVPGGLPGPGRLGAANSGAGTCSIPWMAAAAKGAGGVGCQ
jgi:hypothetical protein